LVLKFLPVPTVLTVNNSDIYRALPVVSICSQQRHGASRHAWDGDDDSDEDEDCKQPPVVDKGYLLDLHTSECYIRTADRNLTVHLAALDGLVINGVLDVYTIWRKSSDRNPVGEAGKDAIFKAGDHWVSTT